MRERSGWRKKKLKGAWSTMAPSLLIVPRTLVYRKRQIVSQNPAFLDQSIAQRFHLRDANFRACVLFPPTVEPDFLPDLVTDLGNLPEYGRIGPPDRRRHHQQLAKNLRMLQTE